MTPAAIAVGAWMAGVIFCAGGAWRELRIVRAELQDMNAWRRRTQVALALHGVQTEY
ncbi:MAG: hypothetical protein ACRD2F_13430 [Terriglobales bacterium]